MIRKTLALWNKTLRQHAQHVKHLGLGILFFLCNTCLFAQSELLETLKIKINQGQLYALRDVASLLDKPDVATQARAVLQEACVFSEKEFSFSTPFTKQDFLNFYYKNKENLHYSHLYNAYYLSAIEQRSVAFERQARLREKSIDPSVRLRDYARLATEFVEKQVADTLFSLIADIGSIASLDAEKVLQDLARSPFLANPKFPKRANLYQNLADELAHYKSKESVEILLKLVEEGKIHPASANHALATMTNVFLINEGPTTELTHRYRLCLDTARSMDDVRALGYRRYPSIQSTYFMDDVDFFGSLTCLAARTDGYWWIRSNAYWDMVRTHHPRGLFYLAAKLFLDRDGQPSFSIAPLATLFEKVTSEKIGVKNAKNETIFNINDFDRTAKLNFLIYWATHYNDYEWDEHRWLFLHKKEKLEQKEQYERLFRRLTSTNDSVAVAAYRELSEGDPIEIERLAKKYKTLLRNLNPLLPSLKVQFLENLAYLTDYCREHSIVYFPTPALQKKLDDLQQSPTISERYRVENELITTISLEEITVLEYWALTHENSLQDSYSMSRVLDWLYTKHWQAVITNETALKYYLKKASLFSKIGTIGVCNFYLNKFDLNHLETRNSLVVLQAKEKDPAILSLLDKLLTEKITDATKKEETDGAKKTKTKSINDLIEKTGEQMVFIETLNAVLENPVWAKQYRQKCVAALKNVVPPESIFQLQITPKLSPVTEASLLDSIPFGYKDLDDFAKLFDANENPKALLTLIEQRMNKLPTIEQGTVIQNLFRQLWFNDYVISAKMDTTTAKKYKNTLITYLNESENVSEFEEQSINLHLTQFNNIGKTLEAQLETSLRLDADDNIRSAIQSELIARIDYSDIRRVIPFVEQLSPRNGTNPLSFLSHDFGIPVFDFSTSAATQDFIKKHTTLSVSDFYKSYLTQFGIDFLDKKGNLDYDKVYDLLQYDITTPFTGGGGNRRDWYVYGIIKLLELKYKTTLDFHPKLNENQTFFDHNSSKRATAWKQYLLEKGLVKKEKNRVGSFSR